MTTLLVTEVFPPRVGGSGRWFWEIYRRLPREKYVIAAGDYPGCEVFDSGHDLRVVRSPLNLRTWGVLGGAWGYARALSCLRRSVRQYGVRQIHCGRCLPEGLLAWAMRKLGGPPYLCYSHGDDLTTAATSRELTVLARLALAGADLVIANSRNTGQLLLEDWKVPLGKIRILHPGVDTKRFVPAIYNEAVRHSLGWGARTVILTVGRLQMRKGQDMMIRALPAIRERVPEVLYAIAGNGDERAALEALTDTVGVRDAVLFMGEVSDEQLVKCYQQCDLFALPNRTVDGDIEGFGMVLLEAQACGKPVLAGDSGGTAETMQSGETGEVVRCDQPEFLADAVLRMLSHPGRLDEMEGRARAWAVERFDWAALTRQAEELFGAAFQRES
jgi:phosphatidyl-myo-inositol dimannoside synthase